MDSTYHGTNWYVNHPPLLLLTFNITQYKLNIHLLILLTFLQLTKYFFGSALTFFFQLKVEELGSI